MKANIRPPKVASVLLRMFMRDDRFAGIMGDINEIYINVRNEYGRFNAFVWFWLQVVKSFPGFIINSIEWGGTMLANYLKIGVRNIKRQKWYSLINVFGLALGLVCSLLIFLWINDELSFDVFHKHSAELYRIDSKESFKDQTYRSVTTPVPLAPALKEIPEIEYTSRFTRFGGIQVRYDDKSFYEENARCVDPDFFKMFSFSLIDGEPASSLADKFSVLLTPETAEKYFGSENAVGRNLRIENKFDVTVTGIIEKAPQNSTLQYDMIFSFDFVNEKLERMPGGWVNAISTFVMLNDNADKSKVEKSILQIVRSNRNSSKGSYELNPLLNIRLYTVYGAEDAAGQVKYVYIFSLIAIVVLLIACFNFINLTTSRSIQRSNEVGIRKVTGAIRSNLIAQFYTESFIMMFLALLVALALVVILLPVFNAVTFKNFSYTLLLKPEVISGFLLISLFTAVFAGSYPSLYLSSFMPAKIFGKNRNSTIRGANFRKILVVIQFTFSITLIFGTLVINEQLNYMRGKDLGYSKDQVIYIRMMGDANIKYDLLRTEMTKNPGVVNVSACGRRPSFFNDNANRIYWEGKTDEEEIRLVFAPVDFGFVETMELEIVDGRSFNKEFATDSTGYILNEKAVKALNLSDPVGEQFGIFGMRGTIVGIVKNFHHKTLHDKIEPMTLLMAPNKYWLSSLVIKIDSRNIENTINVIESTWKKILPATPFVYRFMDEDFERFYSMDKRLAELLSYFSIMGIIIALIGLLGLVTYSAQSKTKEIGIRKTLGASNSNVVGLIMKEYLYLILIALGVSLPASYLIMNKWLEEFAYRTAPGVNIFLITGSIVIVLTFVSVFFQSLKAAIANPVDSLKYE